MYPFEFRLALDSNLLLSIYSKLIYEPAIHLFDEFIVMGMKIQVTLILLSTMKITNKRKYLYKNWCTYYPKILCYLHIEAIQQKIRLFVYRACFKSKFLINMHNNNSWLRHASWDVWIPENKYYVIKTLNISSEYLVDNPLHS